MRRRTKILISIPVLFYILFLISMWTMIDKRRHNSPRYFTKVEEFKKQNIKPGSIIFLGNSITEGYDLEQFYNNSEYINRGIAGDMTSGVLQRLDEIIARHPEKIVLLIGINDISRGIDNKEILNNYEKILKKIKNESPDTKVLVVSVLPVQNTFSFRRFLVNTAYFLSFVRPYDINGKIVEFNKDLRKLAKKYGYQYIDIHDNFTDPKGNFLNSEYASDYVHLNEKGYALMTKLLKPHLLR